MSRVVSYVLLLLADWAMTLTAWILAPVLPMFAIEGHLPDFLSWFDTPDNPLDGDSGFISEHAPYPGEQTGVKRYVNRVAWLLRNPAYGFTYSVLSHDVASMPRVIHGDPLVSDSKNVTTGRATGLSGCVIVSEDDAFEFYYVRQWGSSANCLRLRLGWKMLGFINQPAEWPIPGEAQFVFSLKLMGKFDV